MPDRLPGIGGGRVKSKPPASLSLSPDDFDNGPPGRTIRSEGEGGSDLLAPATLLEGAYAIERTLGQGGSAIVRLARQHALGRDVALKSPLDGTTSPAAMRRILQEGWVTGALDHPGVVAVHDIAVDKTGCPHIVMRKIEGGTWAELLADPARVQSLYGVRDVEEWHLRTLMSVAATVHHAHQRGVIHRDLKPDNVMVGPGGEVVLLDWGIAVAINAERAPYLPLAADQCRIAGTPHFMAPELASADGPAQGVATDVYLLGGLLHAILKGDGPHTGEDARRVIARVPLFEYTFEPGLPDRLQEICARALSPATSQRPASAEDFRRLIQAYLEERAPDALFEAGSLEDSAMQMAILQKSEPEVVLKHFAAARANYEQAARSPSGSIRAEVALAEARANFARWQLGRGFPEAAHAVVSEMTHPPAELLAAIDKASRAEMARKAEAEAVLADRNPADRIRTRAYVSLLLGLFFTLAPAYAAAFHASPTYLELHTATGTLLVLVLGCWWWARESLEKTSLNRLFIRTAAIAPVAQMTLLVGLERMGIPSDRAVHFFPVTSGALTAVLAAAEAPWFFVATAGYALAFVVSAEIPGLRWALHTLANALLAGVALAQWGPAAVRIYRKKGRG